MDLSMESTVDVPKFHMESSAIHVNSDEFHMKLTINPGKIKTSRIHRSVDADIQGSEGPWI